MKLTLISIFIILLSSCASYPSMEYVCNCDQQKEVDSLTYVYAQEYKSIYEDYMRAGFKEAAVKKLCDFEVIWLRPSGKIDWKLTPSTFDTSMVINYY